VSREPASGGRPFRQAGWGWLLAAALPLAALAGGCNPPQAAKSNKPAEVVVTTPVTAKVVDYQDFTGRLDAFRTVDIRARVGGYIVEAPFQEGTQVAPGDVLFAIDSQPYKADLDQAEANLNLAIADRRLQEANATRAATMLRSRSIGREEYDQILAARDKARANVRAVEAARFRASVFLGYTKVSAPPLPSSGASYPGPRWRVSRRYVDPGNLVKADDTLLTSLVSDDVLYGYFDVDERTYLDLQGWMRRKSAHLLPVLMRLANEDEFTHPGEVDFVDNRLNGNTGTIRMRGVFPNGDGRLKPGLFVRVRLPTGDPKDRLLIPDEALQNDQGRKCVYVVDAQNTVQYRRVEIGQAIAGLRVIETGLAPGERVIISGQQRAKTNAEVEVKTEQPPKPPAVPLLKLLGRKPSGAGPRRRAAVKGPGAPPTSPVSQNADRTERAGK
jgi:RND family efflux transporter MFP subunit